MSTSRSAPLCGAHPAGAPVLDRVPPGAQIAVFRASRIGDFICALPALEDLKTTRPDCQLTLVALPMLRELAARAAAVDDFADFPGFPGIAEQFFTAGGAVDFFRAMQARRFDLVIQMHGSGTYANPAALMFGGTLTAGWVAAGGHASRLDETATYREDLSEVARCRDLVASLGGTQAGSAPRLVLTPDDDAEARTLLAPHPRPWIGIHPHARDSNKIWPLPRYFEVAGALVRSHGGTVFVLGDAQDHPIPRMLTATLTAPAARLVDLSGATTLVETAAVIGLLDLFIGNDSGPAHLAYAAGTPSVTIFGGTDPHRWVPRDWPGVDIGLHEAVFRTMDCRPCEPGTCPAAQPCLEEIGVAEVVAAANAVLSRKKNEPAITGGL